MGMIEPNTIDILEIDRQIRSELESTEADADTTEYDERIGAIEKSLQNPQLTARVKKCLEESLRELELQRSLHQSRENAALNFYLAETMEIMQTYRSILATPQKIDFLGTSPKNPNNKQKTLTIQKFLEVAKTYRPDLIPSSTEKTIICQNCSNKKDFELIEGSVHVCSKCFARQHILGYASSYTDVDRVNVSSKYMYDPRVHFRDCMNQYQGKQNCTIPLAVYQDLERQLELHHLLVKTEEGAPPARIQSFQDIPHARFQQITKNQILLFLKELGYPKHYENVHLIHFNLTGISPDNISHLEEQLLADFDALIELYNKLYSNIKRKSFINTQYVLYQLLYRHKHPCNKEDFIVLKTVDLKAFHDDICKTLFTELGWNMSPYF